MKEIVTRQTGTEPTPNTDYFTVPLGKYHNLKMRHQKLKEAFEELLESVREVAPHYFRDTIDIIWRTKAGLIDES